MKKIVLIGGGGHALSVADSIIQNKEYDIVGYTDFVPNEGFVFKYLGNDDILQKCYNEGVKHAFICLGYMGHGRIRDELYGKLKNIGFEIPYIVDGTASIACNCRIGSGTYVGKNAVVNANSVVGDLAIINTGAIIEHSCSVGDYSHVAVGSVLCGEVIVGDHSLIGAGTTVLQGVHIGNDCIIGMGSNVLTDVGNGQKRYGLIKDE